ncbi:MFS transporter [Pararhizobium mangrovi]|uniref:MFS transporter n=1 Tax=Pararhizobium mangrovi TaxID=2590452 RepID=A0A506UDL0_9HYPH|nr:MFS transporter [Pararhizobium mangrovi]TPW32030.1 MFS transporter [Pararhizobium mangrovi]
MSDDKAKNRSNVESVDDVTISDPSRLKKTVAGTAIGNFTEWYDFGVYSYIIPIISAVFFSDSSLAGLASFAGLAVSFLVRPIGGIFWGFLGDRIGRQGVLAITVLMMAGGTFGLGVLPGYAAIGIAAPILLFVLRAVQGFSTGGEYVGAMTFLTEHAPDRQRGHLCSFLPVGTLAGYICGAVFVIVLQETLSHEQMISWGWRLPFFLALPLGIVGLYLRMKLEESPAYEKQDDDEKMDERSSVQQVKETIASQWKPILVCIGLVLSFNVTNYMLTGYLPTYMSEQLDIASNPALIIIVIVMAIILVIVTFLGLLSDKIGRKPIMMTGSILLVVASVPLFYLIRGGDYTSVFLGTLPIGLMLVCFMSTEPSSLPTLFPTSMRYGATSVGYNLSVSLFGGTTPLIAAALVKWTGNLMMPAYILVFAGVVGVVSIYFMREPAGKSLKGSSPTVANEEEARRLAAK